MSLSSREFSKRSQREVTLRTTEWFSSSNDCHCWMSLHGEFIRHLGSSFAREFDSVILQWNPRLTDVQVEKEWEKSFATWLRYREEVDTNALEREVESDEEEESPDDEDEFEEDDEDDAELDISSASDDEYR
ncbi:hypothetical protein Taro_042064 [Colocasia esculenta]|uniref:Uncharacterized protein n=1 Tax=Colocasia esculenta TaxID=4460 RepID=A0A843WXK4_COLES|nr:hypothetical protein [Colocasia esculenta]